MDASGIRRDCTVTLKLLSLPDETLQVSRLTGPYERPIQEGVRYSRIDSQQPKGLKNQSHVVGRFVHIPVTRK
jgi:hypothetical protein